ncbi:MAG TPA: polysaccharide deacetylase family protein [Acidobacteriota bacterium]|nr:polysaccharide deacetylase family protein [Acidobacteriota bacterium]
MEKNATAAPKRNYARYTIYASLIVLAAGFVYFGLLADAFYSGGSNPQQQQDLMAPSLPVDVEKEEKKEEISITRPINGMKSASQFVEVEGSAPANAVVAVYLNGSLVESTVAREALYRFPKVMLTKHANVLQTRFYSDDGSSNFSPAIMVLYQDSIQTDSANWRFFQNSPDNISRGNINRKELVLTFDGGSEANSAESILTTLRKHKVRSTIFLTGEFIQKFPELTRRIAQEHEVGNHTFSHEHLTTFATDSQQKTAPSLKREELQIQLRKTDELFYLTTGKRMTPLWRAPYGEHNVEIRRWAAELGYVHVAWTSDPKTRQNLDSLDWVPNSSYSNYFPAMLIKDRILSFGHNETAQTNGAIVLMHLGTERAAADRVDQWLPEIIQTFRQRGYDLITASELIDRQDLLPNVAAVRK